MLHSAVRPYPCIQVHILKETDRERPVAFNRPTERPTLHGHMFQDPYLATGETRIYAAFGDSLPLCSRPSLGGGIAGGDGLGGGGKEGGGGVDGAGG